MNHPNGRKPGKLRCFFPCFSALFMAALVLVCVITFGPKAAFDSASAAEPDAAAPAVPAAPADPDTGAPSSGIPAESLPDTAEPPRSDEPAAGGASEPLPSPGTGQDSSTPPSGPDAPDSSAGAAEEAGVEAPEAGSDGSDRLSLPSTVIDGYDYAAPVPEAPAVDNSYFADAVFIGDSRTEGLMLYSGLTEAKFLTGVGLMVDTVFTSPIITSGGGKVSVMDALAGLSFSKVYVMLGVNELGWVNLSVFQDDYGQIIDRIREINPDALIYVQSILPVSSAKSSEDSIYNNPNINRFNDLIREVALEKQVYYVNVAEGIADAGGCLPAEGTFDGVHLTPDYCVKWLDYLKLHTASPQTASEAASMEVPVQEETES